MRYHPFKAPVVAPDAIVVKLYSSGDQVRGYVRKVADPAENDTIFPGEEMEPEEALNLAATHSEGEAPILIELTEGVEWNPAWGELMQ